MSDMAESTQQEATVDEPLFGEPEQALALKTILSGFVGGAAGVVVMSPVIAGIPILLGAFQMDPLAGFADLVIAQADALLGLAFFVAGGVVVLPLFFVVTASFLPPKEPAYLRGATISTLFWVSFVFIFWPGASAFVNGVFLVVTLVSHWIYGAVLGLVMRELTGIPEVRV